MMTENEFWALIDEAREASGHEDQPMVDFLVARLVGMGLSAVQDFNYWYDGFEARAYRWSLWDACYLVHCGCGDSGFSDFRAWLIGRGEIVYRKALEDPETLVDQLPLAGWAERSLWAAAIQACEDLGVEPTDLKRPLVTPDPEGESVFGGLPSSEHESTLQKRFPALFAKFGDRWKGEEFWLNDSKPVEKDES